MKKRLKEELKGKGTGEFKKCERDVWPTWWRGCDHRGQNQNGCEGLSGITEDCLIHQLLEREREGGLELE